MTPTYWSVEEDRDPDSSAKRRIREKRFNAGEPKKALYDDFEDHQPVSHKFSTSQSIPRLAVSAA